ncbi:glycosyltransferase [candidate division KSB1 bacterium]|nr:glycosyltransferase [candidate division KSB1 bacterium]MBL7093539.1 glycosyltransferase [candidate division KSB1 bacterium]
MHEKISEQVISKPWIPKLFKSIVSILSVWIEKIINNVSNNLIAATPKIAEDCPSKNTIVVQNFPILNVQSNQNYVPYQSRENNIIYVGDLTKVRGIKEITVAMERLPVSLNTNLFIGGNFPHIKYKNEVMRLDGWSKVNYLGYIDRKTVIKQLGLSRIGLVVLHPIPNYISSQPVKMYEYMNAGIPFVASDFPLWKNLIEKIECGLLVDPLDPQSIADAIEWLLKNPQAAERMGSKGKEAVQNQFNWEIEENKLINFYRKIV